MPSLTEIAVELYAGPRSQFVAERNARAREATDQDLAIHIRNLRKPSIAAWVVNVFAQERAQRLGQALRLAEELRQAQADLDAEALTHLGRQRRALTERLTREAGELASARGQRVTPTTLEAVQRTLTAAFFDPSAAAAVASGRLVRELEPVADFSFAQVVAGGPEEPGEAVPEMAEVDDLKARRERRGAARAVRNAEQELERATRDHAKADRELKDVEDNAARLAARVATLEAELTAARKEEEAARGAIEEKAGDRATATERLTAARRTLEEAQAALAALYGCGVPQPGPGSGAREVLTHPPR